jgi:hypothetical protein
MELGHWFRLKQALVAFGQVGRSQRSLSLSIGPLAGSLDSHAAIIV